MEQQGGLFAVDPNANDHVSDVECLDSSDKDEPQADFVDLIEAEEESPAVEGPVVEEQSEAFESLESDVDSEESVAVFPSFFEHYEKNEADFPWKMDVSECRSVLKVGAMAFFSYLCLFFIKTMFSLTPLHFTFVSLGCSWSGRRADWGTLQGLAWWCHFVNSFPESCCFLPYCFPCLVYGASPKGLTPCDGCCSTQTIRGVLDRVIDCWRNGGQCSNVPIHSGMRFIIGTCWWNLKVCTRCHFPFESQSCPLYYHIRY